MLSFGASFQGVRGELGPLWLLGFRENNGNVEIAEGTSILRMLTGSKSLQTKNRRRFVSEGSGVFQQ